MLKKGQAYTEADVPQMIVDEIAKNILRIQETADWQGDTTSLSAYLSRYDGLCKIINAASGVVSATSSTFNSTNARTIVKNIISNIPAALKGDPEVEIVMGYDAAEIYRQALMDANLYHVAAGANFTDLYAEGSVHKIRAVHGLDTMYTQNTLPCIFALQWSNVFLGVDMQNEEEQARMWVDGSDMETVKYRFAFRRGWQVAIPSEIVKYTNS